MFIFLTNPCSVARDAISEGVLNEALKATPKIEINIPTIIKAKPYWPTPVFRALANGLKYYPLKPIATKSIKQSRIVTLVITAIKTRGIFFSGLFV